MSLRIATGNPHSVRVFPLTIPGFSLCRRVGGLPRVVAWKVSSNRRREVCKHDESHPDPPRGGARHLAGLGPGSPLVRRPHLRVVVFVGPAIGYTYADEHVVDLSAVGGVGFELSRTENSVIGGEVAYSISLPLYLVSYYGFVTGDPLQGLSLSFTLR